MPSSPIDLQQIFQLISNTLTSLGIQASLVQGPAFVYNVLIPFALFAYAMKLLLEQARIFNSSGLNWGLAILISLSSIIFISAVNLIYAPLAIVMIFMFKMHGVKGIFIGAVSAAIYFSVLYPFLVVWLGRVI